METKFISTIKSFASFFLSFIREVGILSAALTFAFLVVLGVTYVRAWTGPPAAPPGPPNADTPLNVGSVAQYKQGALGVGGLLRADGLIATGVSGSGLSFSIPNSCGGNWLTGVTSGIFSPEPGGGCGDEWYIASYPRSGEARTLEIGIKNDSDDQIALTPSSNVVTVGSGAGYVYLGRGYYIGDDGAGDDIQTNAPNMYVYDGGWRRLLRQGDVGVDGRAWMQMINCGGPVGGCPGGWTDYTGDIGTGWCSSSGDDTIHVRSCYKNF